MRLPLSRPPKEDPRDTGVTFVDVLFALVVGKILDVSLGGPLPSIAVSHLVLASVLTLTSWVGYHNSVNRSRYFLRFWNLPIFLFLIDILLVLAYWLLPAMTVHYDKAGQAPDPESLRAAALVAAAAALYVLWDLIALWIRKSGAYPSRPEDRDIPRRRHVSYALLLATVVELVVVIVTKPTTNTSAIVADAVLIVLLLAYRTAKEAVTPADSLSPRPTGPTG